MFKMLRLLSIYLYDKPISLVCDIDKLIKMNNEV